MEMTITLIILMIAIIGMNTMLVNASWSSERTKTQGEQDTDVAIAMEKINKWLIEARDFDISTDGSQITFYYPVKDGSFYDPSNTGTDGVARTIYVSDGKLYSSEDSGAILENIPANDPDTGQPLEVFEEGVNSREIVVTLATTSTHRSGDNLPSTLTDRIRPRNLVVH